MAVDLCPEVRSALTKPCCTTQVLRRPPIPLALRWKHMAGPCRLEQTLEEVKIEACFKSSSKSKRTASLSCHRVLSIIVLFPETVSYTICSQPLACGVLRLHRQRLIPRMRWKGAMSTMTNG
ncbi:unnamed protein product [Allacma fusca]|uniref:Uncharacterized protein n=1 Tax=Allacma fusca TaxID=39272 RepID=A0A8J2KDQ9_9HEXA|nr:unnamed protein product [Allacma fusca]